MSKQKIKNPNKFVLLSGANGGIGSKILSSLINANYNVIALDLSNENIEDLGCEFIKCDITNKSDLNNALKKVKEITNSIYAIVNTVGIFMMQSLIEGSEEDFRKIMEVNFFGIYSLNKMMFHLLEKEGRIINLTSEVARYSPQPFQGYYNITKIALDAYNDALRREANYIGIKVIKIQSGSMKTNMLNSANNEYDEMVNKSEHFKQPLTKFKYMMDRELTKQNDPVIIGNKVVKILNTKNPRLCYKVKNSKSLKLIGGLPEKMQDNIYKTVIK